tara:strand:- start:186 stop:311 length:126 start_codon:yes stop_codon:yes gene_type:complete
MGLSGSGKSTLANEVVKKIKEKQSNILLIVGNKLREIFYKD